VICGSSSSGCLRAALDGCSERAGIPAQVLSDGVFATSGNDGREQIERDVSDPAVLARCAGLSGTSLFRFNVARSLREPCTPIGEEQTSRSRHRRLHDRPAADQARSAHARNRHRSGYQAAVLAELGAEVYSIEIIAKLAESACATLSRLGYRTVRCVPVMVTWLARSRPSMALS